MSQVQKELLSCEADHVTTFWAKDTWDKKMVCAGLDLEDSDLEITQEALQEDVSTSARRNKAKPKAKAKANVQKKPAASKAKGVPPKGASVEDAVGSEEKKDAQTKKSSWKRRMTSWAYHSAGLVAKTQGKSPNTCKIIARTAHQKMSNDIDAGLVKNPEGD